MFVEKLGTGKLAGLLTRLKSEGIFRRDFGRAFGELARDLGLGTAPGFAQAITIGSEQVVYREMRLPPRGTLPEPTAVAAVTPPVNRNVPVKPVPPPVTPVAPNVPSIVLTPVDRPPLATARLRLAAENDHLKYFFDQYAGEQNAVGVYLKDQLLAAESRLGVVDVFNAFTGEKLAEMTGHSGHIIAIDFSPDGKLLATASKDGVAKIWRVASGVQLLAMKHAGPISAARFSPDGNDLLTLGDKVYFWNTKTGANAGSLPPKNTDPGKRWDPIKGFAVAAKTLATFDRTIRLWDLATKRELTAKPIAAVANAIALSPDGSMLAWSGTDRRITLWDTNKNQPKGVLRGHESATHALAFSPDGKVLASGVGSNSGGDKYGEIKLWELEFEAPLATLQGHRWTVTSLRFDAEEKWLASASRERSIRLWPLDKSLKPAALTKPPAAGPFEGHAEEIATLAAFAGGRKLLTGGHDGTIRVWDVNGVELACLKGHTARIMALAGSADGQYVYSASLDSTLRRWDFNKGSETDKWSIAWRRSAFAFSPDATRFAFGYEDVVRVLDANTGKRIRDLADMKLAQRLLFSQDGAALAAIDNQKRVCVWDLRTGRPRFLPTGDSFIISCMAMSSDARFLATSCMDQTVSLWDVSSGQRVFQTGKLPTFVRDVQFAPDGRSLLVAMGITTVDSKTKLYMPRNCMLAQIDTQKGEILQYWDGLPRQPREMALSPDGREAHVVIGNSVMRMSLEDGKAVSSRGTD